MKKRDLLLNCTVCSSTTYPYFDHKDFFGELVTLYKCINCGHGSYNKSYTV